VTKRVPLLSVARLGGGRVGAFDGLRGYVATGSVDGRGNLSPDLVTYEDRPSRADLTAEPGDVCFARMAATDKAVLIRADDADLILSTGFAVVRPDPSALNPRFLLHWLRSKQFHREKDRLCTGATQRAITNEKIALLSMPLPPLREQERIVAVLDCADAVRDQRRRAPAPLDEMTRSLYRDMVKSAETRTIGDLLAKEDLEVHKDGNHGSLYPRASEFAPEGVPFITAKAIADDGSLDHDRVDHLNVEKASQLRIGWIQEGDVLLSHNASVGKVAIYDGSCGSALIGTSLTCFRVDADRMDPSYLAASLEDPLFQSQLAHDMAQTTRNQVPITAQRRLSIPWLPLQQQMAFGDRARKVATLKVLSRTALAYAEELLEALQIRELESDWH
jgi:type I restriction enzyme S subunit